MKKKQQIFLVIICICLLLSNQAELLLYAGFSFSREVGVIQNCKHLFMYMNNWDKGVAPAIGPRILSTCEYWISAGAAPPYI